MEIKAQNTNTTFVGKLEKINFFFLFKDNNINTSTLGFRLIKII